VLVEEARTNLLLWSSDLTQAAWTPTNLTAAKTATGPDGVANSASTLTATAANAFARQPITSASAARITSMFVKRRTGTGAVYLSQGQTTGSELVVNGTFSTDTTGWTAVGATLAVVSGELEVTNTGASAGFADSDAFATVVGTAYIIRYTARRGTSSSVGIAVRKTAGGSEASVTVTSTSNVDGFLYFVASSTSTFIRVSSNQSVLGRTGYFDNISCKTVVETTVTITSDWTRVSTASATVTNPPLIIRMATSGDAIDVALFQIENGAFITSPIPTTNNPLGVTRAADQVSILTSAFPYSATAGTVVAEFDKLTTSVRGVVMIVGNTTGATGTGIAIDGQNDGFVRAFIENAGSLELLNATLAAYTANVPIKGAVAYASNNAVGSAAGNIGTVDTSVVVPTVDVLQIGSNRNTVAAANIFLNGHIKRLAYYASRKTDAELQVLST
jgi:hypothetical protein